MPSQVGRAILPKPTKYGVPVWPLRIFSLTIREPILAIWAPRVDSQALGWRVSGQISVLCGALIIRCRRFAKNTA